MLYTYVIYRESTGRYVARSPAWGERRGEGDTRAAALAALFENVSLLAEELFCRELPLPEDVPVEVGCYPVFGSD